MTLWHCLVCRDVKVSVLFFAVQRFWLISWRLLDGWKSNLWKMKQCDATFDRKMNAGYSDLHFTVQWFCLISWRLFDGWTSVVWIISQCDPPLTSNVGHNDQHFMVQWFFLISWRPLDGWTSNVLIMNFWPQNECRSLTYFCGPVILPHMLDNLSVWCKLRPLNKWTLIFWIMSQCDATFDLKMNVGHSNLYFMVQWFFLISWRLFYGWLSYFWILSQYDTTFDLK